MIMEQVGGRQSESVFCIAVLRFNQSIRHCAEKIVMEAIVFCGGGD